MVCGLFIFILINFISMTEIQTGWHSFKALDMYSGSSWFESRPGHSTEVFHGFPEFLQENAGMIPRLSRDRFLPNPFRFFIRFNAKNLVIDSVVTSYKSVRNEMMFNKRNRSLLLNWTHNGSGSRRGLGPSLRGVLVHMLQYAVQTQKDINSRNRKRNVSDRALHV